MIQNNDCFWQVNIYTNIFLQVWFFFNSELNFLRHLHKKGLETGRNPWLDSSSSGEVAKRIFSIPLSSVISCLPYKTEGKYRPRVCEVLFTETLGGSLGWVGQEGWFGLVWFFPSPWELVSGKERWVERMVSWGMHSLLKYCTLSMRERKGCSGHKRIWGTRKEINSWAAGIPKQ